MSDDAENRAETTPIHIFDQTNGVLSKSDGDEAEPKSEKRPRGTRKGSEANTALGAHGVILGGQGGF